MDFSGQLQRENSGSILASVMTVAGSDSGGGAGIQADLKTFTALGVFGTSAITCITAQNPSEVRGIEPIDPAMVALQIDTICGGFNISAAKTGMLYSSEIICAAAAALEENNVPNIVVDPVMVATSGARLLKDDAVEMLCRLVIPLAAVVTPNIPEAEMLCGLEIRTVTDLGAAAAMIGDRFGVACVVKGGHMGGHSDIVDVLYEGGGTTEFALPRVEVSSTHGTGCTFSAAMAASLAIGKSIAESVEVAKRYVSEYIKRNSVSS